MCWLASPRTRSISSTSFCRGAGAPVGKRPAGRLDHRSVFTIGHVARLLGEDDEDCLYELSISMFPEDGCLHVYGVGEVAATAFTPYGIECLKQFVDDERAAGRAPKPIPSTR